MKEGGVLASVTGLPLTCARLRTWSFMLTMTTTRSCVCWQAQLDDAVAKGFLKRSMDELGFGIDAVCKPPYDVVFHTEVRQYGESDARPTGLRGWCPTATKCSAVGHEISIFASHHCRRFLFSLSFSNQPTIQPTNEPTNQPTNQPSNHCRTQTIEVPHAVQAAVEFERCKAMAGRGGYSALDSRCRRELQGLLIAGLFAMTLMVRESSLNAITRPIESLLPTALASVFGADL